MGTRNSKELLKGTEFMSYAELVELKEKYQKELASITTFHPRICMDGDVSGEDIAYQALANLDKTELRNAIFKLEDLIISRNV